MIDRIGVTLSSANIHDFVVTIVTIDDKVSTIASNVINIFTELKDYVPGAVGAIKQIKGVSQYLGHFEYLDRLKNLVTGETFKKNMDKPLKLTASLLKFMTSTAGYVFMGASLLSAHPYVMTAIAVAKVANKILVAHSLGFNIASILTEGKESLRWNDYVQMIALASVTYLIVAPLLMANPPLIVLVGTVANVTMGLLFLWNTGSTVYNYLNPPPSVQVSYLQVIKDVDLAFAEDT